MHSATFIGVATRRSGRKPRLHRADNHLACVIICRPDAGRRKTYNDNHFADLKLSPIQERLVEAKRHRFLSAQQHLYHLRDSSVAVPACGPTASTYPVPEPTKAIPTASRIERQPPERSKSVIVTASLPGTVASTPETEFQGLQIRQRNLEWIEEVAPEDESTLQLCLLDLNPPKDTGGSLSKESVRDYFEQNDYFVDESNDGRFSSEGI